MDRRRNTRLAAAHIIPVRIAGLGDLSLQTTGSILNISSNGLRISVATAIPLGSFLRVEFEDATIFAEVRYCHRQKGGFVAGVFVEEILIGKSELARLVASLVSDAPEHQPKESVRTR